MNRKRIVIGLAALLVVVGVAALGQSLAGKGGHWHRGDFVNRRIAHLTRALDLTDAQQQQVKSLVEGQRPALKGLMQQMASQRAEMLAATQNGQFDQAKVQAIANQQGQTLANLIVARQELQSKIYGLLTPEQRTKFDQMQQRRLEHMQKRLGSGSQSQSQGQ
ncbi:MAG TPA: Spy/CpxP family protein refolding chaperone [Terriglobales bacterium]|jgi:periplasmic protein CpxP/Spy|nr:Spy/CpxP family protein refolding chaperone [Terriglobales bacterium]